MRTRRNATITELRLAIDCLPRETKLAMLTGIRANPIIVGAYTSHDGICPMLAAHRAGGRTNFISFAKAWDRFAFRNARARLARRATDRELLVLRSHLEASLLEEEAPATDFGAAIAQHRDLLTRAEDRGGRERDHAPGRPGDEDRSTELAKRPGWAWLRVMRRYDEYERALKRLQASDTVLEEDVADVERLVREPAAV
jgi:hypothetical protein